MSTTPFDQPLGVHLPEESSTELRIPVLAETATVTRELVETGRVRLTKTVVEHQETLPLDLRHDEMRVERVAVNQFLPDGAAPPDSRYEGDTLIVPVLREVLVKRLLLVEELHVTKQQTSTSEPQTVTLRHEEVVVERLPPLDSKGTVVLE